MQLLEEQSHSILSGVWHSHDVEVKSRSFFSVLSIEDAGSSKLSCLLRTNVLLLFMHDEQ